MPTVICVANQKGGIGKTTTATAIATILDDLGHKTLFIDADPQCNSTDTYRAAVQDTPTLYDVILDLEDPLPIMEAIQHTEIGDIIACDPLLKEADTMFPDDGKTYSRLRNALSSLTGYEYVVMDTGPADNKLLKNCLVASDLVIIPVNADRYSIQGLSGFYQSIMEQKQKNNPKLKIAGILLTKYKARQTLAQEVLNALNDIAKQMNTKVFTIRESTAAPKYQATRTALIRYNRKCTTAIDYQNLVAALLKGDC